MRGNTGNWGVGGEEGGCRFCWVESPSVMLMMIVYHFVDTL